MKTETRTLGRSVDPAACAATQPANAMLHLKVGSGSVVHFEVESTVRAQRAALTTTRLDSINGL